MLISLMHSILCAACFLPIILVSGERRRQCRDALFRHWQLGLLAGAVGIMGDSVLIFSSVLWTTSTRASLLANTSPAFMVLLAALFLHERISRRTIAGIVLGFLGVFLVFFTQGEDRMSGGGNPLMWLGDLLALLSGLTWAAYTVIGVPLTRRYDLFVATFIAFFWGAVLTVERKASLPTEMKFELGHYTQLFIIGYLLGRIPVGATIKDVAECLKCSQISIIKVFDELEMLRLGTRVTCAGAAEAADRLSIPPSRAVRIG